MARARQYPPSVKPGIPKLPPLPSGWNYKRLGEVLEVVKRPAALLDDQSYQLVTTKRNRGGIVPRERLRGDEIRTKTQFYCSDGDFLISRRQIIHGACGVVPEDLDGAVVSNEYSTLRPKPPLLLAYLEALSHTTYFQRTCFHSSIGVDVEKMIFKLEEWLRFRIPVPPLPEQRRIVAILSTADEAIHVSQAAIEHTRRLKEGLLQDLLSRGVGHMRFRKMEFGEIPESWEVLPLNKVGRIVTGGTPPASKPDLWGEDIPFVTPGDISDGADVVSTASRGLARSASTEVPTVPPGSVLVTCIGTIGKAGIAGMECGFNQQINAILPNGHDPRFIYYAVSRRRRRMLALAGTQAVPIINKSTFGRIRIAVPPLPEQAKISGMIATVESAIEAAAAALHRQELVKSGLLHDLLTGKVRAPL